MKNNDIKVLSRGCKIMYAVYLFAVIFFAGVYELLPEAKGQLVGNDVAEYALDTVCVLLTMITAPLPLKLFAHATQNNIGGFCALICVAASLLFAPTQKRIAGDLDAKD